MSKTTKHYFENFKEETSHFEKGIERDFIEVNFELSYRMVRGYHCP